MPSRNGSSRPQLYAQVVEEHPGGVLAVRYTYGEGLDAISETRDPGAPEFISGVIILVANNHSGVRQAVAASGAVLLVQRFDAYGQTVAKSGTLSTPIGYRGERFDATLGQYYLRARFYDPSSGRFTAMDPFAGTYGDPLQAMRYGYAGSNPIANSDPTGLVSFGIGAIGSFLGVAGSLTAIGFGAGSVYSSITGRQSHWAEGFIPGWGAGREYSLNLQAGSWWAAADVAFGALDIIGIGWLGRYVPGLVKARWAKATGYAARAAGITGRYVFHAAAQAPGLVWRANPGGLTRTIDQAVALARRWGVHIPDDVVFHPVDFATLGENTFARYKTFRGDSGTIFKWDDFYHNITKKIPVIIREDVLQSDEAIVAIIAHEMHELNNLRTLFAANNNRMTIDRLSELLDVDIAKNLHSQAWDVADQIVNRMRGGV